MKTISRYIMFIVLSLFLMGCNEDALMPTSAEVQEMDGIAAKNDAKALKATGDVEVTYMSNPGGHSGDNHQTKVMPEPKLRFADVIFDAHEASKKNAAKGDISITIKDEFGAVKREIKAEVYDVKVDADELKAWIIAEVITDERHGGNHDDGTHDDGTHDDGTHDDGTHDDGAHDGGTHDGGTHDDGTHDDGTHDDGTHDDGTHDDGTHDDGTHDDHDGGCGSDDDTHGNKSRVGDSMALVVYDGGTPGTKGDELRWKWYGENHPHVSIPEHIELGELCQKEIIGGNLVVHIK